MVDPKSKSFRPLAWMILATIVFASACVHKHADHESKPDVLNWVVVHTEVHYKSVIHWADGHDETSDVTEHWSPCDDRENGCYDVRTTEEEAGQVTSRAFTRYVVGADGFEWIRDEMEHGYRLTFRHPKVVLTASPAVGQTWSQVHVGSKGAVRRTCRTDADSTFCAGGLATTCRTSGQGRDILIRDHFCRSLGWMGDEASVFKDAKLVYHQHTTDLALGSAVEPPLSLRHFPSPADIAHPGPVPE